MTTKRKKPLNTTKPTMEELDHLGYVAQVVEVYVPWCKRKRDFAGFADVLAYKPDEPGVLAIQTTSRDHVSHRLAKILATPAALAWLKAGNRIEVWGWFRVKEGRRLVWKKSVRRLGMAQAEATEPTLPTTEQAA